MTPKRKRTVSLDLGCGLDQSPEQKPRCTGEFSGVCMQQFPGELSQDDLKPELDTIMYLPEYSGHEMRQFMGELPQNFMEACVETQGYAGTSWEHDTEPFHELSQNECKAEPEEPMDYQKTYGSRLDQILDHRMDQYVESSICEQVPPLHPDVDLALDNNYADDSNFLPCDSNMGLEGHAAEVATSTTTEQPIYVTTPSGSTIKLTPSPRLYSRSYYDDLTYNPKSTDYKFTTAAQLLNPHAFDDIGWSPEHYAGLTNPIAVPASAYLPRPPRSPSDPVRRTLLTTNRDLAMVVGWMRRRVTPMHQQGTGLVHPDFPTTWAGVALLTEEQLDALAEFYHQTGPTAEGGLLDLRWQLLYPCPMTWRREEDGVWVKRRKMMEFIGIRKPAVRPPVEVVRWLDELEEEVCRRAEEERDREDEREELRRKLWACGGGY